jgi:hypothetical protein
MTAPTTTRPPDSTVKRSTKTTCGRRLLRCRVQGLKQGGVGAGEFDTVFQVHLAAG